MLCCLSRQGSGSRRIGAVRVECAYAGAAEGRRDPAARSQDELDAALRTCPAVHARRQDHSGTKTLLVAFSQVNANHANTSWILTY